MKEKNRKNHVQNAEKNRKDDIALYRIILLLLEGMIGFPLIGLLGGLPHGASVYVCIIGCVILAAGLFIPAYFKFFLKREEEGKLITSRSIGVFFSVIGCVLALYPFLYEAADKLQVAFIMVILLGCVYNLYTRGFFHVAIAICIGIVFVYFINNAPFTYLELFLKYFSRIAVFPVAAVGLVLAFMKIFGAKNTGKMSFVLPETRFYAVISAIVWLSVAACAVLLMLFSALYAFILAYFIVLFIVLGIICTIKLL
ncbi:MAG: hypothetical protein J6C89_06495 [Clostridia bacterium]|nr:hypothetical protein [Clostridia bacterium]